MAQYKIEKEQDILVSEANKTASVTQLTYTNTYSVVYTWDKLYQNWSCTILTLHLSHSVHRAVI